MIRRATLPGHRYVTDGLEEYYVPTMSGHLRRWKNDVIKIYRWRPAAATCQPSHNSGLASSSSNCNRVGYQLVQDCWYTVSCTVGVTCAMAYGYKIQ